MQVPSTENNNSNAYIVISNVELGCETFRKIFDFAKSIGSYSTACIQQKYDIRFLSRFTSFTANTEQI